MTFGIVGQKPVLVDFFKSLLDEESVRRSGAASPIRRGSQVGFGRARRLFFGSNAVAEASVGRLIDLASRGTVRPRILVVGGATIGSGMDRLYGSPNVDVIAFDIYSTPNIQFVADAHNIPIRDQSIDGVVIQAVLEHVLEPEVVVRELGRVLRSGAPVYAETPFMQQVHEGAYDFKRFTESGHRFLFRRFAEVSSGVVAGPAVQLIWSIDYLFRGLFRSRWAGRFARCAFFWLRWLDVLIPERYAIDGASCVFFLGTSCSSPIASRDIVARYRGAQSG